MAAQHAEQQYLELFAKERTTLATFAPAVVDAARDEAYAVFKEHGFPTHHDEQYRYIDIPALFAPDYGVNLRRRTIGGDTAPFRCLVPALQAAVFYVVNDTLLPAEYPLPEGVSVAAFATFAEEQPQLFAKYYNSIADRTDSLTAFNTMFAEDGIVLHIAKGTHVDQPLQIINILSSAVPTLAIRRVLVLVEEQAQATLLVCDHSARSLPFLTSQVVEVHLAKGAALAFTTIEETHDDNRLVSSTYIAQEEQTTLTHHALTLHNGITRNNLVIALQGEGAQCQCFGAVILDKQQQADNNTYIKHIVGECDSSEKYKYVLNGQAHGVFTGRVLVCQDAQKTNSQIRNQNLCAAPTARMQAQPMLEIYADDVKCAHGATIGQLNDSALFYMRQRGIPEAEARRILQIAFVREVIDNIALQPLRERLQYLVDKRFRGELNTCEGCALCL